MITFFIKKITMGKNILFISAMLGIMLIFAGVYSQEKSYFDADYSVFKTGDTKSTVELYFSFTQRGLSYAFSDGQFRAQANINVSISDIIDNKIVFNETYGLQSLVKDTAKNQLTSKLIGQQNYLLAPGDYRFILIGFDSRNLNVFDTIKFDVSLPQYESSKTYISGLQLSTSIQKSEDKNSIFYKNGLEVTPNPNLLFGNNLNQLHYYIEIYGIKNEFFSDSVFLISKINDMNGNLKFQNSKLEKSKSNAFVEIGSFRLDSLLTGKYNINLTLVDKISGAKIEKDKYFFIYNSGKVISQNVVDEKNYLQSEFVTMSEKSVDDEFEKVIYIRTKAENDDFQKLKNIDDKRRFLYGFWKRRDVNPETPKFEARTDYFKRIDEANRMFKQGFTEGWKTDRGRIYVTYGNPSDIERHPFESETRNYEIWTYDYIEGGTKCVFVETQQSNSGFYYLVHSTIRNEIRDPDWERKLKK